jgi:hypothetical protein
MNDLDKMFKELSGSTLQEVAGDNVVIIWSRPCLELSVEYLCSFQNF